MVMVAEYSYCPVDVKQCLKGRIVFCKWSPKTDLIALGSDDGCVSVHQYKMTCIWECPSSDQSSITCLAWRPDGSYLAASYTSGCVQIYLANDGFIYHKMHFDGPVSHLGWADGFSKYEYQVTNANIYFPDIGSLAAFQSDVNFTSGNLFKLTRLFSNIDKDFTILTIHAADVLHFYACESFELARLTTASHNTTHSPKFIGCHFSTCMRHLLILLQCVDENGHCVLELQRIPCQGLVKFGAQLRNLAVQHSSIRLCKRVLDISFDQICSSWEDMILELDSKFTKYAKECLSRDQEWSLSAELLEFILFGHCPSTLRKFLVEDWTAHSLKRTGTATLKAYESIKIICFQQLQYILQRMLLHSSELLGNLRDTQRYAFFGLTEEKAIQLCSAVGSVLQKAHELHLVIEKSIIHLRAFFKWLYVAILGLSGRILPDDFPRVTPPERELVIEFITQYLKPVTVQGVVQGFHIDLVQQYIRSGEVRRPLEDVVDQSLPENEKRSKLRALVNLPQDKLFSDTFPVGLFPYNSNVTLADLMRTLENHIQSLFGAPTFGNFSRSCFAFDELVSQILFRSNAASTNIITTVHCPLPATIHSDADHLSSSNDCTERKILLAWSCSSSESEAKLMIAELTSRPQCSDFSISRTVCITVDALPSVTDSDNESYKLLGVEFFTSESLLLLVGRSPRSTDRSILSCTAVEEASPSWFVMLPVQELLSPMHHTFPSYHSSSTSPLYSLNDGSVESMCPSRLSELITSDHIEPLPWDAVRFASNGERSIVFVLFKTTNCRVYLLERPEAEEHSNDAEMAKSKEMESSS